MTRSPIGASPESGPIQALEPCPFCGGAADMSQIGNEHTKSRGFEVKCLTWGCATKKRAMVIRHTLDDAKRYAVAAWNTRASTASPEGLGVSQDEPKPDRTTMLEGALRPEVVERVALAIATTRAGPENAAESRFKAGNLWCESKREAHAAIEAFLSTEEPASVLEGGRGPSVNESARTGPVARPDPEAEGQLP